MFTTEALPDLDRQSLPTEDVGHRQCAELLAIADLVGDEVEAPGFVRSFAAQNKAFLATEPVDAVDPGRLVRRYPTKVSTHLAA